MQLCCHSSKYESFSEVERKWSEVEQKHNGELVLYPSEGDKNLFPLQLTLFLLFSSYNNFCRRRWLQTNRELIWLRPQQSSEIADHFDFAA